MSIYKLSRKELKSKNASDYKNGDRIDVGRYSINIVLKKYDRLSLESYVTKEFRMLDCTHGIEMPYYIDDFLGR